jgi:hypothetical protein
MQPLRYRSGHLIGWLWTAFLLQTRVVVGRHVAQRCDFFTPKTFGPAASPVRQTNVARL